MSDSGIKGPRPISLHFANSQRIWDQAARTGSRALKLDIWNEALEAKVANIVNRLEAASYAPLFDEKIKIKAHERKESFLAGINSYISRPFERPVSATVVSKKIGCVSLLDFGGNGKPILMVPSLVNPYYILDLMPGSSFAQFLKEQGFRPFLLDWGSPGLKEEGYGLSSYIENRLEPMLAHVASFACAPVPVIGYCMGGTLCSALAVRNQKLISRLVLLAAPWDFATDSPLAGRQNAAVMLDFVKQLPAHADVGVDMLQTFFTNVDPTLSDRKFRAYEAGKYQGLEADFFSAMEIWANNGPSLARVAAEDCLGNWYRDNQPCRGEWMVGGQVICPEDIMCPVFVAAPKDDRLVPQESAFAILQKLRQGVKYEPPSGHIGMVVGNRAKLGLWEPVLEWLEN